MFYGIGFPDLPAPLETFPLRERHPPKDGPLRFRPMYADLVCRKCDRVDEFEALSRGVSEDFVLPPLRRDAFATSDHFLVVTRDLFDALSGVPAMAVHAFAVPSSANHLVLFPKRQFHPPANARLYNPIEPAQPGDAFQVRGHPCRKCGRIRRTTFQLRQFDVPADVVLAAAMVEIGDQVSASWIASQAVIDVIAKGGFKGFSIRPANAF